MTRFEMSIQDYKQLIDEAREEGLHKIADLWARELETLLANQKLVGNKS